MIDFVASRFTPERKVFVKDGLVALSLGFLVFIRVWNALLRENYYQFFAQVQHNRYDFAAVLLNTLSLAAILFVLVRRIRARRPEWLRQWAAVAFICALAPVVDFGRRLGSVKAPYLLDGDAWPLWLIVFGALVLAIVYRVRISRWVYRGLIALSPAVLLAVAWASYWGVEGHAPQAPATSPRFAEEEATKLRVIWLVFDELDERVTFGARPSFLKLPAFDALRARSIRAVNAFPPAGLTFLSVPSMLSGRFLEGAAVREGRGLAVRYQGENTSRPFPDESTLLNELSAGGKRSAVFGWFFPYERMFPDSAVLFSRSFAFPQTHGFSEQTLGAATLAQLKFSFVPPLLWHKNKLLFESLHEAVLSAIRLPATDFVFAHYSVPHAPGIFDRPTWSRAQAFLQPTEEYFGNLPFADGALADILRAIEMSGVGDRTALIVTSDHWWRASATYYRSIDNRVPLLVSMPDRGSGDFGPRINLVHCAALVRSIFDGSVADSASLLRWLAARESQEEFRYAPGGEIRFHRATTPAK